VSTQPLHSLTAKLPEFILAKNPENVFGIFIFNVALLPTNHVQGLNQICHSSIPIAVGRLYCKKFCVPVSVKSNHAEKVILPSSLLPDIFAKYRFVNHVALELFTRLKLFIIPCPDNEFPIAVYIVARLGQSIPHKAISVLYAFILFPLTVFQANAAKLSPLPIIADLIV
jgi:hypothetical protein